MSNNDLNLEKKITDMEEEFETILKSNARNLTFR